MTALVMVEIHRCMALLPAAAAILAADEATGLRGGDEAVPTAAHPEREGVVSIIQGNVQTNVRVPLKAGLRAWAVSLDPGLTRSEYDLHGWHVITFSTFVSTSIPAPQFIPLPCSCNDL